MSTVLSTDTTGNREDNRMTPGKKVYIILSGFLMVSYLLCAVIGYELNTMILWGLRCLTVPMGIYYGKLWKDKGFWILTAYLLWITLRIVIPHPEQLFDQSVSLQILSGLWVFTGCYGLGHTLNPKQLRKWLSVCIAIWTVGMVANSFLGIYVSWTDQRVDSLQRAFCEWTNRPWTNNFHIFWGFYGNRLEMGNYATSSAAILSVSILMALDAVICARRKPVKILFAAAMLPMMLAMALTDSRTSMICTAVGAGVMSFVGVFRMYERRAERKAAARPHPWFAWPAAGFVMLAVFAIVLLGFLQIVPAFNQIKLRGLIPAAYAEDAAGSAGTIAVAARGFDGTEEMFTGRVRIWRAILQYLQETPGLYLAGCSKYQTMSRINEIVHYEYGHCHNMFFQILIESGVPGLLLVGAFLLYVGVRAFRLVKNQDTPLWIRLMPAIMIGLWVADLDECFIWLRHGNLPMLAFQFVIFGTMAGCVYGRRRQALTAGNA